MPRQGLFKPRHPEKYEGDPKRIVYRSSLELRLMRKLDSSPAVTRWASEELAVPYFDPVKKRDRRYFPDFLVRKTSPDGKVETLMVEVKPDRETRPPRHGPRARRSRVLKEELTWLNNQAKWAAAEAYCAKHGWRFVKVTEKDLA